MESAGIKNEWGHITVINKIREIRKNKKMKNILFIKAGTGCGKSVGLLP